MARKKRSSRSPVATIVMLVVAIAAFIFGASVLGLGPMLEMIGVDPAELEEAGIPIEDIGLEDSGPIASENTSGSGSYYEVYFTSPESVPDGVTTGGQDTNLIALINGAQSTIDLAVFEFNLQQVADALIAAHNRGVQVRVVYDDEHTEDDPQMEQLIDAGIPAVPDERSAFMHNKFWVFDSQVVWTGSTNITENGFYRNNNNAIVIRSSRLAQNYTTEFEEMFLRDEFGPTSTANTPSPQFTINGILIESYFASEDDVTTALVNAINAAESSIHFMAFAFTENDIGDPVIAAANRGVEVAGIFERRGANTEFSECPKFLAEGYNVRIDGNPGTFHHKVIIIDGSTVATGSFNFSGNAIGSNDENILIIHDPAVAQQYEQEFNRRMAESLAPVGNECLAE